MSPAVRGTRTRGAKAKKRHTGGGGADGKRDGHEKTAGLGGRNLNPPLVMLKSERRMEKRTVDQLIRNKKVQPPSTKNK